GEPALQAKLRHSKSPVLVIQPEIQRAVSRFGYPPWDIALPAVFFLHPDNERVGLVEDRVFITAHDQGRHQVFKHRTCPRTKSPAATGRSHLPSRAPPVFPVRLASCYCYATGLPGLGSKQLVV